MYQTTHKTNSNIYTNTTLYMYLQSPLQFLFSLGSIMKECVVPLEARVHTRGPHRTPYTPTGSLSFCSGATWERGINCMGNGVERVGLSSTTHNFLKSSPYIYRPGTGRDQRVVCIYMDLAPGGLMHFFPHLVLLTFHI